MRFAEAIGVDDDAPAARSRLCGALADAGKRVSHLCDLEPSAGDSFSLQRFGSPDELGQELGADGQTLIRRPHARLRIGEDADVAHVAHGAQLACAVLALELVQAKP